MTSDLSMPLVLTLVSDEPAILRRELGVVERAISTLEAAGCRVGEPDWLAPGRALDLPVGRVGGSPGDDPADLETSLRSAYQAHGQPLPVDLALQPTAGRRKRLLVADMESTIIRNEMLDELADAVNARHRVEEITARAMRGELDFRQALDLRVGLLAGLDAEVLDRCRARVRLDPGARALVATARAHGTFCALVSGGFHAFADPVAADLGFDAVQANRLEIEDGRLTGRVVEPILDRDAKRVALDAHCRALGIEPSAAAAVGDGANDLAMLDVAGLGVAYHGKPAVAEAARFRIDLTDLTTLLWFQGYRESELVLA